MERKIPFIKGESYHLYSRGVEKRKVFMEENDYARFVLLLLACNSKEKVHLSNGRVPYHQGEPLMGFFDRYAGREKLVDILAYSLMPNHFHLVVEEKESGGISRFMLKLMTAYAMFFNTKYERSGPLFTRPFRSAHIDSDAYMRWVFAYVHLNPLEIFEPGWKERGIRDMRKAAEWLKKYRPTSYYDYFLGSRPETSILTVNALAIDMPEIRGFDALLLAFSEHQGRMLL